MEDNFIIQNEILINNNMLSIKDLYSICKSTIKIVLKNGNTGSGFFIKYKRDKEPFYCLMTNEHVISSSYTNEGDVIIIKYDNEKKELIIELNQLDRQMLCLKELLNIDVTIIQIIPKDNIDDSFFLLPMEENYDYDYFKDKSIRIVQYPGGQDLSMSEGKITLIDNYLFHHNADTLPGSSGSPIVLKGEEKVLGIHKGRIIDKYENIGIFIIGIISEIISQLKREGPGKEYYKNGDIKYDGNFVNDKYNGQGVFYYENRDFYIGEFKNGKQTGNGSFFKDEMNEGGFKSAVAKINDALATKFKKYLVEPSKEIGRFLGSYLGYRCKKCKHENEVHIKIKDNIFECLLCPNNDNICEMDLKNK